MSEKDVIAGYRSKVIERAINIESILDSIICQHYFGKVYQNFVFEVLYDEQFSFGLKRRILEKIVSPFESDQKQALGRVNNIRNIFAHCNQLVVLGSNPLDPSTPRGVPDPRKEGKFLDLKKLYKEFADIAGPLEEYLSNIYIEKGGKYFKDEDFVDK